MPAKGHTECAGGGAECQGHGDRHGPDWRWSQKSWGKCPECRSRLARDKGAIALALPIKPVPGPELPFPAHFLRLDGAWAMGMLLEHQIDQQPRSQSERHGKKKDRAAARQPDLGQAEAAHAPAAGESSPDPEGCLIKNAAQHFPCRCDSDKAHPFTPEKLRDREVELGRKAKDEPRKQAQDKGEAGGCDQGSGRSGKSVRPF